MDDQGGNFTLPSQADIIWNITSSTSKLDRSLGFSSKCPVWRGSKSSHHRHHPLGITICSNTLQEDACFVNDQHSCYRKLLYTNINYAINPAHETVIKTKMAHIRAILDTSCWLFTNSEKYTREPFDKRLGFNFLLHGGMCRWNGLVNLVPPVTHAQVEAIAKAWQAAELTGQAVVREQWSDRRCTG